MTERDVLAEAEAALLIHRKWVDKAARLHLTHRDVVSPARVYVDSNSRDAPDDTAAITWDQIRALVERCREAEADRDALQDAQDHKEAGMDRLEDENDRLKAEYAAGVQRLLDDMRYMEGIAVRGFGQPTPTDVPIRTYVLRYVKQLEAEIDRLKAENARIKNDVDIVDRLYHGAMAAESAAFGVKDRPIGPAHTVVYWLDAERTRTGPSP
jgi:hypothetical protein